jgi:hypothetical protein
MKLPRGIGYEERALALAKRLGLDVPSEPLTDAQWLALWAAIGKVLLPIKPPEPRTLQTLCADAGMYLAELTEPEFRPGDKNKQLALSPTRDALRKRRQRQRS